MNPLHNPSQIPITSGAVQQVNPIMNQQMGVMNSQQICNGNFGGLMPNTRPVLGPSGFMNVSNLNQPFPLGQVHNGIGGLTAQQNFNSFAISQRNPSEQQGQFFAHNSVNLTPHYNQNVSLPSGQFFLQNALENVSQLLQMQNPNYTQFGSSNFPMFQNQIAQSMGRQSPNFCVNQQFGLPNLNFPVQHVNQEQRFSLPMPLLDDNASKQSPNTGQPLQGSSFFPDASGLVQSRQAQSFGHAPTIVQEKHGNEPANIKAKCSNSQSKNFRRHDNHTSQKGFRSQFHHGKHVKGKFRIDDDFRSNAYKSDAANSVLADSTNHQIQVKKKLLSLNYTEQEIRQWREDRKKHYPSRYNIQKKLTAKQTLPGEPDQDAKLRCEQLKEILAKQAELGCEVADIPSSYLSYSEKQSHGGEENKRGRNKDMFRNKLHKRGKPHLVDRFVKKERSGDHDVTQTSDETSRFTKKQRWSVSNDSSVGHKTKNRESSLLQKLLTRDVRRDKSQVLQVFRFITSNSFFTGLPDKSLRYPSVVVRETGAEGETVEKMQVATE